MTNREPGLLRLPASTIGAVLRRRELPHLGQVDRLTGEIVRRRATDSSRSPRRQRTRPIDRWRRVHDQQAVYGGDLWTSRPASDVQWTALLRAQRERVLALAARVVPGRGPAFVADAPTSR